MGKITSSSILPLYLAFSVLVSYSFCSFQINFHKKAYSFILLLRTICPSLPSYCSSWHCTVLWVKDVWREKKFCCRVYAVVLEKLESEVPTRYQAKDKANKTPSNLMLASVAIQTVEMLFIQFVVFEHLFEKGWNWFVLSIKKLPLD